MEKISLEQIAGGYVQKAEDKNSNCGQNAEVERRVRFCSARRRASSRGPAATTMMTRAPEFNIRPWVDLSAACASDFEVLMMWTVTGSMPPKPKGPKIKSAGRVAKILLKRLKTADYSGSVTNL
jgi:hypothetical protein